MENHDESFGGIGTDSGVGITSLPGVIEAAGVPVLPAVVKDSGVVSRRRSVFLDLFPEAGWIAIWMPSSRSSSWMVSLVFVKRFLMALATLS